MSPHAELAKTAAAAIKLMDSLNPNSVPPGGSLTVVGTGIRAATQLTVEALAHIAQAEVLLHVIGEPLQEEFLAAINPRAQTLTQYYVDGMDRWATYEAMVQHILDAVMNGHRTVAAFYGHPGVFTYPTHESVRRARAAGYPARMLPGISAEDNLVADLGVDPGDGSQAFEATDFLYRKEPVNPSCHLFLWQVGAIGNTTYESDGYDMSMFPALVAKLLRVYPPHHPVTVYEAPFHPKGVARAIRVPIAQLDVSMTSLASTLHVPPLARA